MTIYNKLLAVQVELKAPKSQYNSFGKYKYRNCEDILESLKPILEKVRATVIISDEIVNIADRFYVKATAKIVDVDTGDYVEVSAFAREDENKKGMDSSQITGSTSSYARKYALNGLFAIDDNKDADTLNRNGTTTNNAKVYLSEDLKNQINARILLYSKLTNVPVAEVTKELSQLIKKDLKYIDDTEANILLESLNKKISNIEEKGYAE